jgi:hypothetical protein
MDVGLGGPVRGWVLSKCMIWSWRWSLYLCIGEGVWCLKKGFLGYVVWWGRGCGFRVLGNFATLQVWELEMQNWSFCCLESTYGELVWWRLLKTLFERFCVETESLFLSVWKNLRWVCKSWEKCLKNVQAVGIRCGKCWGRVGKKVWRNVCVFLECFCRENQSFKFWNTIKSKGEALGLWVMPRSWERGLSWGTYVQCHVHFS